MENNSNIHRWSSIHSTSFSSVGKIKSYSAIICIRNSRLHKNTQFDKNCNRYLHTYISLSKMSSGERQSIITNQSIISSIVRRRPLCGVLYRSQTSHSITHDYINYTDCVSQLLYGTCYYYSTLISLTLFHTLYGNAVGRQWVTSWCDF